MNMPFSLRVGLRYAAARRRSQSVSFLSRVSIIGLTVGVSLLVTVLSVMNGFDRELQQRILALVPQGTISYQGGIYDWRKLQQRLEAMDGIEAAAPMVQLEGLVRFRDKAEAIGLYGFDPTTEARVSRMPEFIDPEPLKRLADDEAVIMLGKGIADNLGAKLGDRVMVIIPSAGSGGRTPKVGYFELVQIVRTNTELDAVIALSSLSVAAALTDTPNAVTAMKLKVRDLFAAQSIVNGALNQLEPGYRGTNWTRRQGNLYHAIQVSKRLVGLLMSLIVAIAAFNVVSTLVLVVVDKQGDIAILRTLGASDKTVMTIFMFQGAFIGLVGTSLGLAVGCLLALGVEEFVRMIEALFSVQFLKSDAYPLTYLPTDIRMDDLIQVALTSLGLCFLATIYPAWKASRVRPAEALRYE